MRAVLEDDGFGLGIFLAGNRRPFQPESTATRSIAQIEEGFAV